MEILHTLTAIGRMQDDVNALSNKAAVEELAKTRGSQGVSWRNLGRAWHRAIWMEGAEMAGAMDWKWWSAAPEFDLMQAKLELVDIFHFLVSWAIQEGSNLAGFKMSFDLAKLQSPIERMQAIERIVAAAACGRENFTATRSAFADCCVSFGLDLEELCALYEGKNALNAFRQVNGYKAGTYRKRWFDGREDNQHLAEIVATLPGRTGAEFRSELMVLLQSRYEQTSA